MPSSRKRITQPLRIWTFASGSNAAGHIWGFVGAGVPPGVALRRISSAGDGWNWVCADAQGAPMAARSCFFALLRAGSETGLPVFIDTGAYSEDSEAPIRDADWLAMLGQMKLAGDRLGAGAFLVLPDKVGDQGGTLRRLRKFRPQITEILRTGATGIVVLQPGRLSAARFAERAMRVLGSRRVTLGFPVVGGRTSPQELALALETLKKWPEGIHLLGISPASAAWPAYMSALSSVPSSVVLSSDAVELRRLTGRSRGIKPLTEATETAALEIHEEAWGGLYDPRLGHTDPTEDLGDPSAWMTQAVASDIARRARGNRWSGELLTQAEANLFAKDPSAGLRMISRRTEDGAVWLEQEIEEAWTHDIRRKTTELRRERALLRVLGRSGKSEPLKVDRPRLAQLRLF